MIEALNDSKIIVKNLNCKNNGPNFHLIPDEFLKHPMVDPNVKIKSQKLKENQLLNQ